MHDNDDLLSVDQRPDYQSQINARAKIIEILSRVETKQAYTDKLLEKELIEFEDLTDQPDKPLELPVIQKKKQEEDPNDYDRLFDED